MVYIYQKVFPYYLFVGWVKVRWDQIPGSSERGLEEDYRFGVDYEFDVEPVVGGMDAVQWPAGKGIKTVKVDCSTCQHY